jgi:predicted enzyme related to lactoylglutathione lyase
MGSHGSFCWNELLTHDPERAKKFYAETIGWSFDAMPMQDGGTYWVAKAGDKMVGGIFELKGDMASVPESWMPYLAVDNVDKRVERRLPPAPR